MWPESVLRQFAIIPPRPTEHDFRAPYNKLLHTLFPVDSDFVIVPRCFQDTFNPGYIIHTYEIRLVNKPVLFLQLNPSHYLDVVSKRNLVDGQMRMQIGDLYGTCPINILYGVSTLGTKFCFYYLHPRHKLPIPIYCHPKRVKGTTAATCWAYDMLEPAGEEQFRAIVEEIKVKCAALNDIQ